MQMRSGHVTRGAAFGDDLPFIYPASDRNAHLTEVRVIGLVAVIVTYFDKISVASVPGGKRDLSTVGGKN